MVTGEEGLDENEEPEPEPQKVTLAEARQHAKALAVFIGDQHEFSAQDQLMLQRWSNKLAKMTVQRFLNRQQTTITSYFASQ